jgi:capsular polysaccharide transport system permease protein
MEKDNKISLLIRKHKATLVWIVFPVTLGAIYLFVLEPDIYTARSTFLVQPTLSRGAISDSSASLTALAPERSKDAYTLESVLFSWGNFVRVEKSLPLAQWSQEGGMLSGYGGISTIFRQNEVQLYRFYRRHMTAHVSRRDGLLSIRYDAFSPEAAQQILATSLKYAEATLLQDARARFLAQLKASAEGLRLAQKHLSDIDQHLFLLEKRYRAANPKQNYVADLSVIAHLQEQEAQLEAKKSALLLASPNSPSLKAISAAYREIHSRIANIRSLSDAYSMRAQPLKIWLERQSAAEQALSVAQIAYQKAATEAASQPYNISELEPVNTPSAPSGPSRWENFGFLVIACFILWGFMR